MFIAIIINSFHIFSLSKKGSKSFGELSLNGRIIGGFQDAEPHLNNYKISSGFFSSAAFEEVVKRTAPAVLFGPQLLSAAEASPPNCSDL